jgi:hypothetical protein
MPLMRVLAGIAAAMLLSGCVWSPPPGPKAADAVLDAQYRARGSHGAMTGDEAWQITSNYQKQIGTASALSSTGAQAEAPSGAVTDSPATDGSAR